MRRTPIVIGLGVMSALCIGAFLQAVAADPCNRDQSSAHTVALLVGVILLGVIAYLVATRWTARSWVPIVALVATTFVGYYGILMVGLLVYWVPNCAN